MLPSDYVWVSPGANSILVPTWVAGAPVFEPASAAFAGGGVKAERLEL